MDSETGNHLLHQRQSTSDGTEHAPDRTYRTERIKRTNRMDNTYRTGIKYRKERTGSNNNRQNSY